MLVWVSVKTSVKCRRLHPRLPHLSRRVGKDEASLLWLLVSCSETLERGLTRTGLGRGIEVGYCVQTPLARLPGAGLCAEYRHKMR
jgi:hypothetical protein